jgi:membrane protease YdiL (CAAX protease family)
MNRTMLTASLKAVGLWALAYVLLRLTLIPWRLTPKPSLVEIVVSFGLLTFYAVIWSKLRPRLIFDQRCSYGQVWAAIVAFAAWAVLYLGFWRASPSSFEYAQIHFIPEYLRAQGLGGFLLSEITEEIAYRGILLFLLIKSGLPIFGAILLQALVFVLPHYIGVAQGHMDLMRSLSTAVLGMLFGWAAYSTRGLALPVALHVAWNIVAGFIFEFVERH